MVMIVRNNVGLPINSLIELGVNNKTIYNYIEKGKVRTIEAADGRKFLLFDSLKQQWQDLVNKFFGGNAKRHAQFNLIEKVAKCSQEDRYILQKYRLANGQALDSKRRTMYEKCCGLLALLARLMPINEERVEAFGEETKQGFWDMIYAFIKDRGLKLPKSYRLLQNLKKYQEEGATAVVSKKLGMKNRQKLGQVERDTIIALYSDIHGRKFTKKQVWKQFVHIAKKQGWVHCVDITYQQVANVLTDTTGEWIGDRHGKKHHMLNRELVINRRRASRPNLVYQIDGTPAHLWYWDAERKIIDKLYVLKVMDAHSWKIVGYSIGKSEVSTLVFEALKMACVMNQTKPLEIRTDKGSAMQSGETKALFEALGANYFPTATGRARAKTIEAWEKHYNQQILTWYTNKSAGNIDSKTLDSKSNPDKLRKLAKYFPTKEELVERISLSIHLWNERPEAKTGKSPNQKFYNGKASGGEPLELMEQIDLFFIWRKKGKKFRSYGFTYEGLEMIVNGEKYRYLPALEARELAAFMNKHTDVSRFFVKYDPSDLEQIALYTLPEGAEEAAENMRFVCDALIKGKTAETPMDATEQERQLLQKYREVQKQQWEQPQERMEERRQSLAAQNILSGAIELEAVHKDRLNAASLLVEQERAMGFHTAISEDRNRKLSRDSLIEDFIIPQDKDKDKGDEPLDVYG